MNSNPTFSGENPKTLHLFIYIVKTAQTAVKFSSLPNETVTVHQVSCCKQKKMVCQKPDDFTGEKSTTKYTYMYIYI